MNVIIPLSSFLLSFAIAMFWVNKHRDGVFDFLLSLHILVMMVASLFLITEKCPTWFVAFTALHSGFYAVKFNANNTPDVILKTCFAALSLASFCTLALKFS
jgi:hypothetical protein